MRITDIVQQVKNKKRYSVFVEGEFAFGIDGVDLLAHGLEIGQTLDRSRYVDLLKQLEYAKCRDTAVRILASGAKTVQTMRKKLAQKEYSPGAIDAVVELLAEKGYLDDVAFSQAFISHKTKISNYGRRRIEQELRIKGVSDKDIRKAYESQAQEAWDEGEIDGARRALEKKLRNKPFPQDFKELQRLKGFLVRRGFGFETIEKVVGEQSGDD